MDTKARKKRSKKDDEFGEFAPGYMQPELFSDKPATEEGARSRMVRQLGFILILLLVQMVLFFILIKMTLGFSFS